MIITRSLGPFYNDLVIKHWPDFGKNGKTKIRISDVLRHEAGLLCFNFPLTPDNYHDLDHMRDLIVASTPSWPNNTKRAYHAYTRGWILNELVRRTDPEHRTIGKIAEEEICKPLKIEFYIGPHFPESKHHRFAKHYEPPLHYRVVRQILPIMAMKAIAMIPGAPAVDPGIQKFLDAMSNKNSSLNRAFSAFTKHPNSGFFNKKKAWKGEIPSGNGITNAFALSKLGALILKNGKWPEAGGAIFRNTETLQRAKSEIETAVDDVIMVPTNFSIGGWGTFPGDWQGWGGYGGSLFAWNEKKKISVGFTVTSMLSQEQIEERSRHILNELERIVDNNNQNKIKMVKKEDKTKKTQPKPQAVE